MTTTPQSMSDLPELPELPEPDGDIPIFIAAQRVEVDAFRASAVKQYATEYGRLCRATAEQAGPVSEVLAELSRAVAKFPTWPTDPLHAVAVLGEEFGELTQAVLQSVYEPHKSGPADVRTEAMQTAAMALRFLMSLDRYAYTRGDQHEQ